MQKHKAHIGSNQQKHHVPKEDAIFRRKLISEGKTEYNEFPDLTRGQADTISKALSNLCTINDLYFEHV